MKMHLLQQILRVGLFGVVLASSSGQALQNREIIKNNVELAVSVPPLSTTEQPVEITVRLTNKGDQIVYWGQIDGIRELGLQISNSENVVPAIKPFGIEMGGRLKFNIKSLNPGQFQEWRIDLKKYFKLSPGMYKVSVTIEINPNLNAYKISLKNIELTIKL